MSKQSKSVYGNSGRRPIYGVSKIQEPCTLTIPPELDINTYMMRTIMSITSIKDKTSKDTALVRLENISTDIKTIVNNV
jgi:hypothetical protein